MLTVADFNTPQFWGIGGNIPGGYGRYMPIRHVVNPNYDSSPENDIWYRRAATLVERGGLVGLKTLEMGCAFGQVVKWLREMGADAYGLDLAYPISQGLALWPELEPYLIQAEAIAWLQAPERVRNEYEVVISRGFLDCFTDAQLDIVVPWLNFISKRQQIHSVNPKDDPAFYNKKTLAEWQALPWEAGTLILDDA